MDGAISLSASQNSDECEDEILCALAKEMCKWVFGCVAVGTLRPTMISC